MLLQHFDWNLTHQILFLYILLRNHMNLRDQPWRCTYYGAELTIVAANFMQVSLMLDNPFPVPSLCKLNHSSVCLIQISTRITCRESHFFWSDLWCVGPLGKFQHNIEISVKMDRVSRLSFSFLWLWFNLHTGFLIWNHYTDNCTLVKDKKISWIRFLLTCYLK